MHLPLRGGCLCGAVQYRICAKPIDAGYCHCSVCRQSAGAPLVAWLTVEAEAFAFTKGQPTEYRSSLKAVRRFCGGCGTQLTFQYVEDGKMVDVTLASLDKLDAVRPEYHIWTDSQVSWLKMADELPRYGDRGPDN